MKNDVDNMKSEKYLLEKIPCKFYEWIKKSFTM